MTVQTKEPETKSHMPVQPLIEAPAFTDDDLCTVLQGFGRVAPSAHWLLDGYDFYGGVCKDVPYSLAKHWLKGTRPDGKRPQGRVIVKVLPNTATESDYLTAAGMSADDLHRLALRFKGTDVTAIINEFGVEGAKELMAALQKHFR